RCRWHESCMHGAPGHSGRGSIEVTMFGVFSGTRQWVYAQSVKGRFQRLHRLSGIALQLFLVGLPWLRIGGNPAVRVDLPGRRVYLLGTIFSASDLYLLVLMGLFAAFSLFFFT